MIDGRLPALRGGARKPSGAKPKTIFRRAPTAMGKHSLLIAGHSTSISLEDAFWHRLKNLADRHGRSVASLVAEIDAGRGDANLSSAIRVYLIEAAERP